MRRIPIPPHCCFAAAVEAEQLSVTIITVEEILTGWYSQIRRAKNHVIPSDGIDKNLQIVSASGVVPGIRIALTL